MASTADYDAPRRPVIDLEDSTIDDLKTGRPTSKTPTFDIDETDAGEGFDAAADLSDEELTATVIPMMSDEFRCSRCFLVQHRSQLAKQRDGEDICRECA